MANIAPVIDQIPGGGIMRVVWTMAATDVGVDCNYPGWADRNVQVEGVADGATVAIQGSNDGSNWRTLTDMAGNSLGTLGVGALPAPVRTNLQNAAASMNLDTTGVTGGTTIRQALKDLGTQLQGMPFVFNGVTL